MLVAKGDCHGLEFGVEAKFGENLLGMITGGGGADVKLFRNSLGTFATGNEPEDLLLSGRYHLQGRGAPQRAHPAAIREVSFASQQRLYLAEEDLGLHLLGHVMKDVHHGEEARGAARNDDSADVEPEGTPRLGVDHDLTPLDRLFIPGRGDRGAISSAQSAPCSVSYSPDLRTGPSHDLCCRVPHKTLSRPVPQGDHVVLVDAKRSIRRVRKDLRKRTIHQVGRIHCVCHVVCKDFTGKPTRKRYRSLPKKSREAADPYEGDITRSATRDGNHSLSSVGSCCFSRSLSAGSLCIWSGRSSEISIAE